MLLRMGRKGGQKYYAVARGREAGVFTSWSDTQSQVNGFSGARFKSFATQAEANAFVASNGGGGGGGGGHAAAAASYAPSYQRSASFSTYTPPVQRSYSSSKSHTPSYAATSSSSARGVKRARDSDGGGGGGGDDNVVVFTDGACSVNNRRSLKSSAGIGVYFGDNDDRNVSEPLGDGAHTNQRAELSAVIRALEVAPPERKLTVRTDSKYVVNGMGDWIHNWKRNEWRNAKGEPVSNKDLWRRLDTLVETRKTAAPVRIEHVRGHAGNAGNEAADRLAVRAVERAAKRKK